MGPRKTTPLPPADSGADNNIPNATDTANNTPSGRRWLSGTGSWRSKAPAVVRTATESIGISVSGGAASALPDVHDDKTSRNDSPAKFLTKRKSSKGAALPASTTHAHVSTDGLVQPSEPPASAPTPAASTVDEPPLPPSPPKPAASWGLPFAGWWSRPDGYAEAEATTDDAQNTPLPGPSPSEDPDTSAKGLGAAQVNNTTCAADTSPAQPTGATGTGTATAITSVDRSLDQPADESSDVPVDKSPETPADKSTDKSAHKSTPSGSWFWLWSTTQNAQAASPPPQPPSGDFFTPNVDQPPPPPSTDPPAVPAETTPQATAATSKPSGWAFWYTDKPSTHDKSVNGEAQRHVGEVAVLDTPSQSHPEAAQFNEQEQVATNTPRENPGQLPKKESLAKKSFASLRGRPKAKSTASETLKNTPASTNPTTPTKSSPTRDLAHTELASAVSSAPASPIVNQASSVKQEPANLILPEFKNTYRFVQQKSFWRQVRQYFLGRESQMPHLHIVPAPPRISKAVAIGVHGFFPAPIFQRIMGQPTGTSIRFANAAAAAIKDWSEAQGYTPEIEQVALEGEGFVAERVNTLWKLLLNWIEHIKAADFILVACHSQGVPVAIMLVAKLVQFGCISPNAKVGVCAMAGVNMGPFIEYKTKYFGPTAAELFEFSNPQSLVSQMYLAALDEVLRFGVKILYVGSIDDQLVSLEVSYHSRNLSAVSNWYDSLPPSQQYLILTFIALCLLTAVSMPPTSLPTLSVSPSRCAISDFQITGSSVSCRLHSPAHYMVAKVTRVSTRIHEYTHSLSSTPLRRPLCLCSRSPDHQQAPRSRASTSLL
jgi:hypothetical protein